MAEPDAEEENVPMLLNPDWPHMQAVLDDADVLLQVLDARDPLACRSVQIERLVADKGKKLLFVLNKIGTLPPASFALVRTLNIFLFVRVDACPRENVAAWLAHLRKEHPTVPFRSASAFLPPVHDAAMQKGKGKAPTTDAWGTDAVKEVLEQWAQANGGVLLKVAVVGWTNVRAPSLYTMCLLTSST
jgi:nuclear GTP-binding protein